MCAVIATTILCSVAFVLGTLAGSVYDGPYNGDMHNDIPSTLGGFAAFALAMTLSVLFHIGGHTYECDLHAP